VRINANDSILVSRHKLNRKKNAIADADKSVLWKLKYTLTKKSTFSYRPKIKANTFRQEVQIHDSLSVVVAIDSDDLWLNINYKTSNPATYTLKVHFVF
jgi:hypothetical protein